MPFDGYVENICSDMFYDTEKSPKAKELIGEIQILIKGVSSNKNARGTLPVNFSIKMFETQHETICQEGEWTVKAEIRTRKKFLVVGEACMAIFWSTPGFTRENFSQLWVLNRGHLNFCVRSTPLREWDREGKKKDETTNNAMDKILNMMVKFYDNKKKSTVVTHFVSVDVNVATGTAQNLHQAMVSAFQSKDVPMANVVTCLSDNCATRSGSPVFLKT